MFDVRTVEAGGSCDQDRDSDTMSITARRRRAFQRQACLLSVMAAFSLGLALGVFVPLIGMSQAVTNAKGSGAVAGGDGSSSGDGEGDGLGGIPGTRFGEHLPHKLPHFPTLEDLRGKDSYNSVSFVAEEKLKAEDVFRHAFHIDQQRDDKDTMVIKKFDPEDRYIKEYMVRRTPDGLFHKGPEKRLSQPSIMEQILNSGKLETAEESVIEIVNQSDDHDYTEDSDGVILNDIFWGSTVENALPKGFDKGQSELWTDYLQSAEVDHLEVGCGRMQNRMVVFRDGTRACARYRQNTDQIQGELFSFYLGQLLNISNLAPSAASIIDMETKLWSSVSDDISNSQWKSTKPVVITKWIEHLEPAGIPKPFQPLERHLNKLDIRNITEGLDLPKPPKGLLDRLGATITPELQPIRPPGAPLAEPVLRRLVELAQWSDLIVFDYLIANLDRVVNNLYNYQWNADIMAAPAHNLARQSDSHLLVFLDNESGLLHGYRLLKKYEAYHGLLLDNLCVFRRSTIAALQHLRDSNVGHRLNELFERTTNAKIRDVLPPLPEKSIKILVDRIDRVLGQVQKCREIFSNR
ncbi:extracellular serine/threonine protein kinase four-jointed-like [Uranotaenia lowii]|uniref:extracellular serine/threonine protein kinase four-jointed-like n=1 Tax=Uranotaenia lowii TaxID=190385 RepID=UPI00247A521C|nr:extracellular serine/threonine protein kinase four-jointed-like [Uranotaenia lowii]